MDVFKFSFFRSISLPLESSERKCKVADLPVSPAKPIKNEPPATKPSASKGINSLFGAAPIKKEAASNGTVSEVKVKEEKTSPQKTASPKKNDSPKNKKASAKPPAAKSISSFFSAKPAASKPSADTPKLTASKPVVETKENPVKIEPKVEPAPVKTNTVEVATPKEHKKRVLSQSDDDSISGTPQTKQMPANKKQKKAAVRVKNEKGAKNRSRIMQICDSDTSSDEESASTSKKAKIEGDEAGTAKKEKENKTPTKNEAIEAMETEEDAGTSSTQKQKKRGKVKKMVTKTFEDEDGYISEFTFHRLRIQYYIF